MMRSFSLPALAVCAAGLLFSSVASAQSKVGVINFQKALLDTGELKKAATELQAKYKKRQDDLEKLQRELVDLQTQLQGSAGKLSPRSTSSVDALETPHESAASNVADPPLAILLELR